ncbi:hypothetical protein [Nonomuraea endophytica]|uniref:hypothetical protein n=1 Tax=Nonomuraea endophytica TaxID=714136 RepID=UPI0037C9C962
MTSLPVLCGVLGWTAPAQATGEQLVDDVHGRDGDGDGNTVTARTPFRIASLSKSMTAIMPLTDDPIVMILPEFKMTDPRDTKITARSSS